MMYSKMMNSPQEYFQVFLEAPMGICTLAGPEHVFTMANDYYVNMFFGGGRDFVGKTIRQAIPEIEGQGFYELLDKVYSTGESYTGNEAAVTLVQADGSEKLFYLNFVYQAVKNSEGRATGIIVAAIDVTAQVLARKKVEDHAELLRLITDRLPGYISYMDDLGRYRFVNKAYSKWYGLPVEEIEGKTRAELYDDPEAYARMRDYETRALKGEAVSFELSLDNPDGQAVTLNTEFLPDVDPRSGHVRGMVGVSQDVTERERAFAAAEASETRYKSFTDAIPQLMWTSTPDGRVNYANKRCLEYTGLASDAKYGDGWVATIHPEDIARVGEAWNASMKLGSEFKEEYRIRRHDGSFRWFLGRSNAIKNAKGEILYWIGTATDIEEERRTAEELRAAKEAAEEANATKSAFLANMSHEIRTPLGAILGFSTLLKDPTLNSLDRNHYIETINRNGQSLTRLIDDILDLAKVEAGQLDVEEINFSLFGIMTEVVELFKEKTKQKGVYLFLNIDEDVPSHISSDPTRLRQILINIIGNAVKFTDEGGIRVTVKLRASEGAGLLLSVEVRDTGRGLSEQQRERLFKPFTQADNTTTRRFGGTGLGLALSRRLSQALGGDIRLAESAPGRGTTFVVDFKASRVTLPDQPLRQEPKPRERQDPLPLNQIKVLLVDDSPDNQFLVKRILVKNGAEVDLASNGREAVEKAKAKEHDVVLMDIQMPEMDGYQATKTLLDGGYSRPIVALTAHAMVEERAKTKAAGFQGHLTKPLNNKELIETVRELTLRD